MKKIILITVASFLLIMGGAFSQNDTSFWNSKIAEIAEPTSSPGWIRLKEDKNLQYQNFFTENKQAFGLGQNDEMILSRTNIDDLGFIHYRYQHTYKGLKVEGCEYILHTQNNQVISANGKIATDLNINVTPTITENAAIAVALNNINATKYAWEAKNPKGEFITQFPIPELVIARIIDNKDFSPQNFRLAFKMDIFSISPYSRHFIYVDAHTGEVFKKVNRITDFHCNCCNGTAQTLYNGQQTIVTRHRGFPLFNYLLKDNCRGDGIQTYLSGSNVTDGDNDWSAVSERPATSAHWATEITYDFFYNTYGRNSFDGDGAEIEVYTNDNSGGQDNAFWNGSDLHFGSGGGGNTSGALVSLDVVGHEFAHGVTQYEADLVYSFESGALNESFSDIFGAMVEFYAEGNNGNYLIGEDFWIADGRLRDMSNPNIKNHPDTYEGDFWWTTTGDNGGVHTNSGVQNFWFFLLAEGGSGTNDNGDAYAVQGIGRNNAARIAYRNLSVYLTSSSDYADAKNGSIFSAMDLFGTCSNEVLQTVNAWNAVGVSSSTGFGFDLIVNCAELNFFHNGFPPFVQAQPYTARAINNLTANCDITPNGQPVTFIAGNTITLTDGFRSGDNFHAFIDPCLAAANKMANNNNSNNDNVHSTINKGITIDDEGGAEIVENSIAKKFLVFPNPNKGQFQLNISLEEQEKYSIHIHDIRGQLVYDKDNLVQTNLDIDLSTQPKGIYFVNIIQKDKIYTEKIILQ